MQFIQYYGITNVSEEDLKPLSIAAKAIFIFSLPCLVITSSLVWAINSHWLYNYGFEKYDISQTTGLSPIELEKAADGIIHYFNSNEEYLAVTEKFLA